MTGEDPTGCSSQSGALFNTKSLEGRPMASPLLLQSKLQLTRDYL